MGKTRDPEAKERLARLQATFARQLRAAMDLRGVRTQFDLARKSGIPEATISKYLGGKRGLPDLDHLAALSLGLDVRPTDLVPPDLLEQYAGPLADAQRAKKK